MQEKRASAVLFLFICSIRPENGAEYIDNPANYFSVEQFSGIDDTIYSEVRGQKTEFRIEYPEYGPLR